MNSNRSRSTTSSQILGIDLLRFMAALMVVMFHYGYLSWNEKSFTTGIGALVGGYVSYPELLPFTWWGWVGVQIFFVISGFVIAVSAEGRDAAGFFRARLLRLVPALWFFATLALLVTLVYAPLSSGEVVMLYVKSMVLSPKGPWLDGVYWTLAVEVVFYGAVLLLVFFDLFDRLERVAQIWGAVGFAYWMLALADLWGVFPEAVSGPIETVRGGYVFKLMLLTPAPFFVTGLALYLIHRYGISRARLALLAASVLAGEVGIYSIGLSYFTEESLMHGYGFAVSPVVPCLVWSAGLLVIVVSLAFAGALGDRLSSAQMRVVRNLGLATYPLYLFHNISGGWLFARLLSSGMERFTALALALALAAILSYQFATRLEPQLRRQIAAGYDQLAAFFLGPLPRVK